MTHQVFESKLWQAITAVASGIVTSLLYDLVSHSTYVIQQVNSQYVLMPDSSNTKGTLLSVCGIFVLFFSIWGIIIFIIQIGTKVSKQLSFKNIQKISGRKLVFEYTKAKQQTIDLNNNFYTKSKGVSNISYIKLHLRDLSVIIVSLHAHFYPHNTLQKAHMKHYFRKPDHSTIISINNTISKYEFLTLIELLYLMVSQASLYARGNILMTCDCEEMFQMLKELKSIANFTE